MSLSPALRQRIEDLVRGNRVVLFMKGTRHAPKCGFSAAASDALNGLLDDYLSIDVLEDPELRDGIKAYGDWPTIPQLYVDGELVGGTDIVLAMLNTGELHRTLGVPTPDRTPPQITISDAAARAIRDALVDAGEDRLHLAIDGRFRAQFLLKPAEGHEIRAEAAGIEVLMDVGTAQRARGLEIDWASSAQGEGLVIRNPNAPAGIKRMTVHALADALDAGTVTLVDIRPPEDRVRVPFPGPHRVLDAESLPRLQQLPKTTKLAFLCHHGNSSRNVAEHFREAGFADVANVEGGIDAWSREIDPAVPLY
jgi:monothiol glutaredoxin